MEALKNLYWLADFYGVDAKKSGDIKNIYDLLLWVNSELFRHSGTMQLHVLNAQKSQNSGICGTVAALFGHFVIRVFSQQEVAFVDYFNEFSNESYQRNCYKMVADTVKRHLGAKQYDMRNDGSGKRFGVHTVFQDLHISLARATRLVDHILPEIGMAKSGKEVIVLDGEDYALMQSTVGAHIAFHAQAKEDRTLIDVFSCPPFSVDGLHSLLEMYGVRPKPQVISRGVRVK